MSIPADDAGWRELARAGQAPTWKLLAEGSGGRVFEREDVVASIIPAAPNRSVFNSVFYRHAPGLISQLDAIAREYEEAGINAWTVWVPEDQRGVAASLERAGHKFDAEPRDMAMPLSDLREPEPDPELTIREEEDYAAMARINEFAYGYPEGDFYAVAEAEMPGLRIYFADLDGDAVCTLAIWPHQSDAVVIWVAALPEARGRGISGRLLAHALRDAREAGLETTTLQATKLGAPVYEKLGYRDFGAQHMWERRKK
jgi:GNAT superfamily N-acetyltransferase